MNTDAAGYVRAIGAGDFDEAYRIARAPNPLASICGRICAAPCEANCRRGRIDQPIAIRALKRAAFEHSVYSQPGAVTDLLDIVSGAREAASRGAKRLRDLQRTAGAFRRKTPSPKKIAIIGSGPAGLSCAHDLALLGHRATVFEMEPIPAGMLVLGIPAYRLPREIVEQEVEFIRSLGVEFRCNCEIGKDVEIGALLREYDGVVVAVGAKRSKMLPLPGVDGPGVMGGVEFLREVNLGRDVELGRRVVVVGGGNVAFDVARTVVRKLRLDVIRMVARQQHVSEVRLICLEQRHEMPADEIEVIEGTREGVLLTTGYGPELVHRDRLGRVLGLLCKGVECVFDDHGQFAPTYTTEQRIFDADSVLFAVGQRFAVDFLRGVDGLDLDATGAPRTDGKNRTSHPRVWVAGDIAHGPKLAIDAIASGRAAARSIHRELCGEDIVPSAVEVHVPIGDFQRERDYELRRRNELPVLPAEERIQRHDLVVERPPSRLWAQLEASRCLNCSVHTLLDPNKCVLCGGCVDICPLSCLKLVPLEEVDLGPAGDAIEDALRARSTALIKDETACIRCGLCAQRCPTHAITMELCTLEERS